jgi:hypothetical protein
MNVLSKIRTDEALLDLLSEHLHQWDECFTNLVVPQIQSRYASNGHGTNWSFEVFIEIWKKFIELKPLHFTKERVEIIVQSLPKFAEKKNPSDQHLKMLIELILAFEWILLRPIVGEIFRVIVKPGLFNQVEPFLNQIREHEDDSECAEILVEMKNRNEVPHRDRIW